MENQPVVASLSPQKDILDSEQEVSPTKQNATVIESDTDSDRESDDEADRL